MSFSQSDQDLIEAAAKAAGIKLTHHIVGGEPMSFSEGADGGPLGPWNPLADDGDALRLAVKLGLYIEGKFTAHQSVKEFIELGELAAVRRAIVRAAAAIGSELRKTASGSPLNARSD